MRERERVGVGVREGVGDCYYKKNNENITNRMAKFQLGEVRVMGIPQFPAKITPKKNLSPLYSNNHYVDYQYFFEFYNSYVLDFARFEDHTFAFFKGKS